MHEHNHHEIREMESKGLLKAMFFTGSFMLFEFVGGILTGSLALLADSGHMLVDFSSLLMSFLALKLSLRPATKKRTYGLYRLEILAALINGITLALICLLIFREAYERIISPRTINEGGMLAVAFIGLLANLAAYFSLRKGKSLNVRSALLHVLGDTLSSAGIIIGGIVIFFTRLYLIDPILSILISLIILFSAYRVSTEAINILMEATPKGIKVEKVISQVEKVKGVKNIHDIHIWTISSGLHALSAHLLIDDQLVSKASDIVKEVESVLKKNFGITHTTIQIECKACPNGIICQIGKEK
jgi:cobalt-zinc-cadmium efflux system protein